MACAPACTGVAVRYLRLRYLPLPFWASWLPRSAASLMSRLRASAPSEALPTTSLMLTDTVPIPEEKRLDGLTVLSIAPLLASAIRAVFEDGSVAELFDTYPEHHGQGFLFA